MCFERLLQVFARWQPGILFDIAAQPILEYRWIDSYTQLSLRTQFKVATVYSIHTQSLSWCSTGLVPNVLPRRVKARVSPVQSIKPHRILAPTRDSNQEPPGSESRVVTTILPLHTILTNPARKLELPHLIEVFKILRGFENLDPDRFFQVIGDGARRGHSFKLFKKRYRLDVGKFKFASRVCEEWNRLGDGIVSAGAVNVFKTWSSLEEHNS